jgi:hypothetical protein
MHIQVMRDMDPATLSRNPYLDFIQHWSGHIHQDDMKSTHTHPDDMQSVKSGR